MRTRRRQQRGQTAVIALLVLLLLSFIGALFITIIARNLRAQARSHRTLSADYYAEAGLRYADDQLVSSLDGADWRPPLQYQFAANGQPKFLADPAAAARYAALAGNGSLTAPNPNDPDLTYLQQGFTRYNTQNGRFLLRVTYDPVFGSTPDNPTARYLKIESVGREGTVDPTDPTTYGNQPPTRLAATLVAYKPIGITDYARFETNIDNRADAANLGVPSVYHIQQNDQTPTGIVTPGVFDFNIPQNVSPPALSLTQYPIVTTLGAVDAYMKDANGTVYPNPLVGQGTYSGGTYTPTAPNGFTPIPGGGTLRANMNLRAFGKNAVYLNRDTTTSVLDDIEIAGNLLLDNYQPTNNANNLSGAQQAAIILNNVASPTEADYVAPTNGYDSLRQIGTPFDTHLGAVRDGASGGNSSDANGYPRSVARLDPPVIDAASSATRLTRYQSLTQSAPARVDRATMLASDPYSGSAYTTPNAAQYGYGRSIYVNNISDIQRDSTGLVGGHTLMDEWLNANPGGQSPTNTKGGWVGPFYNPPGAEIVFGPQQVTLGNPPQSVFRYGFRITRSDVDGSGNPVLWPDLDRDPSGNTPLGNTLTVIYDELYASNDPATVPSLNGGTNQARSYLANPNNDVLIYLEGNVRVRGIISADPNPPSSNPVPPVDDSRPRHVTIITNGTAYIDGNIIKGNRDSSITILARDYVCVNTTQFLAGAAGTYPGVSDGLLSFEQDADQLVQEFSFGATPATAYRGASLGTGNNGAAASPLALYVSGGAGASGSGVADFDITNPLVTTPQNLPSGIRSGTNPFDSPIVGDTNPPESAAFPGLFDSSIGTGPSLVQHKTYDLSPLSVYNTLLDATTQQPFQLWVRRDQGADNPLATSADQPFLLERAAILPMDIRIEAVLYAQNKSFFVIPGPWFNPDAQDDLQTYSSAYQTYQNSPSLSTIPGRPGIAPGDVNQTRYPLYGQPIDLRITISGAVSEARPADISAQAAWMQKWGWVPRFHGSATFPNGGSPVFEPSGRNQGGSATTPAAGLTIIYDPQAGYPYDTAFGGYLRTDIYGRPLPVTPKLPVSTGLLYSGQNTGQSLLQ
ncbi:MAG: hypothetical protein JO250_11650 [Armatimonadetes bacterium]|nr:hypothetical protein [Armatimonadota bacterium]